MKPVLLIDFGSTYTKVTAVDVESERLLGTADAYTTVQTDVGEGLANALTRLREKIGPVEYTSPVPLTATYHDACHLVRGMGVSRQPRNLIRAIPGLRFKEMARPDVCCGCAGTFSATHTLDTATAMLAPVASPSSAAHGSSFIHILRLGLLHVVHSSVLHFLVGNSMLVQIPTDLRLIHPSPPFLRKRDVRSFRRPFRSGNRPCDLTRALRCSSYPARCCRA